MFLIASLVGLGVAGACAGSVLFRQLKSISGLTSVTAGLFLGMAVLLVFPEAFHSGPWQIVTVFALLGCIGFALIERRLHSLDVQASSSWRAPRWAIFAIIALHNMLDGWNIGVALGFPNRGFAAAFAMGMGVHKFLGGLAVGAMVRRQSKSSANNFLTAAFAEAVTAVGVIAELTLISWVGQQWTVWFLAATGGSFLFLAFHIFAESWRSASWSVTLRYGIAGFLVIAIAAAFEPTG